MSALSQAFTDALGLTLLDSLWQGAIILLCCTLALAMMRSKAARWRYRLVLLALLLLPITSTLTFFSHYQPDSAITFGSIELPLAEMVEDYNETAVPAKSIQQAGLLERWQMWAQQNSNWVVTLWAVGLMIFALRLSGGFYMLRSLMVSTQPLQNEYWTARLKELTASLNIRVAVRLRESARVSSPIVVGYLKPIIIFPLGLIQGIPTDQVEAILLHELAHIRRHDYLLNLLVSFLQVFYFYHPAYWWLQQQLDIEREYSCDDLVLHRMNRLSLVKALTAVKEFQMNQYVPVMGFAGQKNQLLKRVERIMKKKTRTNWLGGLISMTALLLSFFLMSNQTVDPQITEEPVLENEQANVIKRPVLLPPQEAIDSLTVEQAVMQLLDTKENKIILELDGKGRLVDMMRNDEPIGQAELKIFQQAHAKLRDYPFAENKLNEEELLVRKLKLIEQLKYIEQEYKGEMQELIEKAYQKRTKEEEITLKKQLREYELLLRELKLKSNENAKKEVEISRSLDELLRYYPELIKHYKWGRNGWNKLSPLDSIQIKVHLDPLKEKVKVYEIMVSELAKRVKIEEEKLDEWQATVKVEERIARTADELRAMQKESYERDYIGPGTFEFNDTKAGEDAASKVVAEIGQSKEKPLVVVDGEIKENWGIKDLNKIDRSRSLKKIDAVRASNVIDKRYLPYMEGRNYLFLVTTRPGGRNYQRPDFEFGYVMRPEQLEAERLESFTKTMLDKLMADGKLKAGWSSLELSNESLTINGKKQPKKVLKEYLKIYQQIMGKKLPKDKTIELKE